MDEQPENMEAILEWCRVCRPDILPQIERIIITDRGISGPLFLLTIAFEAGRCFQDVNPECPLGPILLGGCRNQPGGWEPITDAAQKSRT